MCCDTKFPLINFAIKKILDLGLHLKLTITDKLFIFDRNHSLHCGKHTTLRSRRPGLRAHKSSNINKLIFSWQFKIEWQICRKEVSIWNQSKRSDLSSNATWTLLPFIPTSRSKVQNPNLSIGALIWTLISFILKKFRHFPIRSRINGWVPRSFRRRGIFLIPV